MSTHLKDRSAQTSARAAMLKQKLQIKLAPMGKVGSERRPAAIEADALPPNHQGTRGEKGGVVTGIELGPATYIPECMFVSLRLPQLPYDKASLSRGTDLGSNHSFPMGPFPG